MVNYKKLDPVCNNCGSPLLKVSDSRGWRMPTSMSAKREIVQRRRIVCEKCDHRKSTIEVDVDYLKNAADNIRAGLRAEMLLGVSKVFGGE